mgnify:CR=1 FL=1
MTITQISNETHYFGIGKILGNNIKTARKNKGLTQKELAKKLSVSVITVQQWEKGSFMPKQDNMIKLTQLLGDIGIKEFTEYVDKKNKWFNETLDIGKKSLLDNFNSVNEDGQKKIIDYSSDIAENPKYKKDK